ncbi:MAG: biotin--[acetyl-CoA-carboxylase] ligase [Lachnospiraceae bacterium]|nr:biotin--[acetyl-CoA-carboxylase] ligase [Candidatus Merdinaster equi]
MNDVLIQKEIHNGYFGRPVIYKEVTGSTNVDAHNLAMSGSPSGTLVVADSQTSGRGRQGRTWYTREANAVAMSLLVRPSFPVDACSRLTLLAGLSVAQAIQETDASNVACVQIKWPNDVVINGKKVCGILTELFCDKDSYHVVIGIGINVSNTDFENEISAMAGSIYNQTGIRIDRAKLIGRVVDIFSENYRNYEKELNLRLIKSDYNGLLAGLGSVVRVLDPKGEYTGTSRGINDTGELLVETEDGIIHEVYAGEVSVRGLYGYV